MTMMTPVIFYLLIGSLLARSRAVDIAAEAEQTGNVVVAAARWVVTWPAWAFS